MSTVAGRPVSEAEQHQLSELQALFKPADALKRIDDFAKWVFTSIAVVGTLGAGFSNAAFATLSGLGRLFLGTAVFLVGASLFAATLALVPRWVHAAPSSRDSMMAALDQNLRKRRTPIRWAGFLFAIALVMSAAAPLASVLSAWVRPQQVALNYEWKADGKFSAQFAGVGLKAYAPVQLSVSAPKAQPVEQARVRQTADAAGKFDASLTVILTSPPGTVLELRGEWADASEPSAQFTQHESVFTIVPTAKAAPTPAPAGGSEGKRVEQAAEKATPKR